MPFVTYVALSANCSVAFVSPLPQALCAFLRSDLDLIMCRFGTVGTVAADSDSSDEEGQAFYAGGSEHRFVCPTSESN